MKSLFERRLRQNTVRYHHTIVSCREIPHTRHHSACWLQNEWDILCEFKHWFIVHDSVIAFLYAIALILDSFITPFHCKWQTYNRPILINPISHLRANSMPALSKYWSSDEWIGKLNTTSFCLYFSWTNLASRVVHFSVWNRAHSATSICNTTFSEV